MRRKRLGCFILTMFLSLSLVLPANSYAASKFSDTAGHWAETYINTAVNKKIITGYPDGRFLPDKAVTRAEFATMVNKALGNTATESLSFGDVPSREWYYNDVAKAVAAAYTAGYDDNTFRPNNPITRQEAAVMISRIVPTYGASGNLKAFSDYRSIADWAYDSMDKVNGKKYIGAYDDGKIHPTDKLTRAQTAKIICDILEKETIVTGGTTINRDGTRLSDRIYANDVTVDKTLREDSATIDNCVILGNLSVRGGGTDTITVNNSRVASVTVNKDDDPVRILAKGETSIVRLSASQDSILQTSSLSGGLFGPGFNNITVNGSADVTLKGSFPKVNITGNYAEVNLDSGTVDALTVSGRYSDITAASGATIKAATVNAESYYHGSGTISQMNVNANGVTYETKPRNWTIASSVSTPKQADATGSITFSPKDGTTKVKRDTKITITFGSEMKLYDGTKLTNSDVSDFITLRKSSSSGTKVEYSASVSSDKKVITITPNSDLSADTKYYLTLDKNALKDTNGDANSAQSIVFTTGSDYGSATTFSPKDGATGVSVKTDITITFSEGVVRYSNGATIGTTDTYLRNCIDFRQDSASGKTVDYTAKINSARTVITITPDSSLSPGQKYYVAILKDKLKGRSSDEKIAAESVTWTTAGTETPTVSFDPANGATGVAAGKNITLTFSQRVFNSAGAVPNSSYVVSAVTIRNNTTKTDVPYSASVSDKSTSTVITLDPTVDLTAGQNFTVTVPANFFKNSAGTYVSSATASFTVAGTVIDTSAIDNAIAAANSSKLDIKVSTDGTNVDRAKKWVTQEQMDTLDAAIITATQAKSTVKSTAEANAAAGVLNSAVSVFNGQKANGTRDKTSLSAAIETANSLKNSTVISAAGDGSDVAAGQYWVTDGIMSGFVSEISAATSVLDSTSVTQAEVDNATSAMNLVFTSFTAERKPGTLVVSP